MKIFQKRSVALLIMVLAIVAGQLLAQIRKPDVEPAPEPLPVDGFDYVLHNEDGALSEGTVRYITAVNASLFEQTGAQIVVDVVETTGSQDIVDYADAVFVRHGIGSRERNNGVLLVLALRNLYNGAPDGDYYISYGSGFSNAQARRIEEIPTGYLEADFVEKRYDAGVQKTFDALVECMEDFYGVTVRESFSGNADIPFIVGNIIGMLILLFFLWILLDAFRYRRYRRRSRSFSTPPVYYPIFWGRPRPPRRPPPPPPPGFGGAGRPPSGGFHGGGSLGGGAGRRPSGGFHSGGSLGGGARRPSGGFHSGGSLGGGARRPSGGFHGGGSLGGGARRPSGGFHSGGSLGGGARRGGGGGRPSGGGRRR